MKVREMKNLSERELKEKISELRKQLMKDKAQIALGGIPENPGKVNAMKKNVARMLTLLNEKSEAQGGR